MTGGGATRAVESRTWSVILAPGRGVLSHMPIRFRELIVVGSVAAVLAVVFTWPIAGRFGSAGRVDSGDGRFSIWNVAWVAHALTDASADLYDANIFSPAENTLAFSEANIVAGAICALVSLVAIGYLIYALL